MTSVWFALGEEPIVGGAAGAPGILAAMRLTPGLGVHMRGLADELLVHDYPGATLVRAEREMLATAVSAANDCFFCMDSHAAFATALLERAAGPSAIPLLDDDQGRLVRGLRPEDAGTAPHRPHRPPRTRST